MNATLKKVEYVHLYLQEHSQVLQVRNGTSHHEQVSLKAHIQAILSRSKHYRDTNRALYDLLARSSSVQERQGERLCQGAKAVGLFVRLRLKFL